MGRASHEHRVAVRLAETIHANKGPFSLALAKEQSRPRDGHHPLPLG